MKETKQYMEWISKVYGDDVLKRVKQKTGNDTSLKKLSATLDEVLLHKPTEKNETELSSNCDPLTFDNDLRFS